MKVEVEFNTIDAALVTFSIVALCSVGVYYISKETQIRQTLVERAKGAEYGQGVLQQVNKFVKGVKDNRE